jgi:serine/threonine protein kinase
MSTHPEKVIADRFEIGRVAGSGGMGVVYKAHDRETDRAVALKILLEHDQGPAARFAHEVELLSALDHPHIIGYVSHGFTRDGSPYLVMPWLDGVDLQERLREGALPIAEVLTLARCVADALSCLHGRGLVHRDLKPSNLFLPDGKVENVKVIDLGVARASIASEAMTLSGTLIGTPGFIAPEQARGDRDVAPSVDIFALGCVLFECITGRRLFTGSHLMSVLAKILLVDAPRVSELRPDAPPALELLVYRMVAKEPETRPRDGMELAQRLADLDKEPHLDSTAPSFHTLTASEQRVLTVLVVVLPPADVPLQAEGDQTRVDPDPFHSSSLRFGVRVHRLADRMAIALASERASAADKAVVLARFARFLVETLPTARVVLTTGTAVTGARLPVGEAIERAVTMVRAASLGAGVQVDEVTAALIIARFDVRREGGEIFVDGERVSVDPTRPLLGRPTSCVGRERELAVLESMFAECASGEGPKVVLVTAGPGAGKSRLRHELMRRLDVIAMPPRMLQCHGDPLHLATPYAMVAQAVRQAAGLQERDSAERARDRLRAHVAAFVPPGDASRVNDFLGEMIGACFDDEGRLPLRAARNDASAMADQVGHAFEDILRGWCEREPLVMFLEDLQWGDAPSVRVLERALHRLGGSKLFVLALARPEVRERFPTLFTERDTIEIRLPPIPKRACAKLLREVMGEGVPNDEVNQIVERSEGNGFYLEELIRAAAEARPSRPSTTVREAYLPETVIAVAQARLERLDPTMRRVLRAASIFGDLFWVEGLSALVGQEPVALQPALAALVEEEAIVPSDNPRLAGFGEYAFRHEILRGTAYATLTESDRQLGHRLAARWLEQVRREDDEVVALHWLEAGEAACAAASFSRAAEASRLRAQADAAARCAVRALLIGDPNVETVDVVAARVQALAAAVEASRTLDARDALAGLERFVAPVETTGPGATCALVQAALERWLKVLRTGDDRRALATILADAACALGALADFGGARALLAEANTERDLRVQRLVRYASAKVAFWAGESGATLALLEETVLPENPRARSEMLLMLAMAVVMTDGRAGLARGLDFVSRAEAIFGASVEGNPSGEDPLAPIRCIKQRYFCFCLAGEYALAATAAEDGVAFARRAGLRFWESANLHNAGEQYLRLGRPDQARAAIEKSNEIAGEIGAERTTKHNDVLLAYLDRQPERIVRLADEACATNDSWLELYGRYWLGHLLASKRALDAERALERALHLAGELKLRTMAEDCATTIAELRGIPPSTE